METPKLPDKPSELIRVALADLERCEASPDYIIDMSSWHEPLEPGDEDPTKPTAVCSVCLAGAVMARSLGVSIDEEVVPCDFEEPVYDKLSALNCFRVGDVSYALDELKIEHVPVDYRNITPYGEDPAQFKADMRKLADDLAAVGL